MRASVPAEGRDTLGLSLQSILSMALLFGCVSNVWADSLLSAYNFEVFRTVSGQGTIFDAGGDSTDTNAPLSRTSALQPEFSVFVQTNFGSNKVNIATARYGGGTDPFTGSGATANSNWSDTFVITGGVGVGLATYQARIDGDLQLSGLSLPLAAVHLIVRLPDSSTASYIRSTDPSAGESWSGTTFADGILTREFQFTYGSSFAISSEMDANARDGGLVNFGSTILAGIILPAGATLTAGSGATYSELAPIPEPKTYALMLAGLGLIGYAARRRKRA